MRDRCLALVAYMLLAHACGPALIAGPALAAEQETRADAGANAESERVIELLRKASSYLEEDAAQRKTAKQSLVEIGAPAVPYLVSRLDSTDVMERIALFDVLEKIGEPAVDALHEAFHSPKSVLEHRRVMSLIGTIGSTRSQPVFIQAAQDADWAIRTAAAAGLGKLAAQRPEARKHLTDLLTDDDWNVRLRAVLALGDAGVGDDMGPLAARLQDSHYAVRLAAAEVLGDQGHRAVGPIARRLEHKAATLVERLVCLQALGRTKHPSAAQYVEPLLIDPDLVVRTYAARTYGMTASASGLAICRSLLEEEQDVNVQQALVEAKKAIRARLDDIVDR